MHLNQQHIIILGAGESGVGAALLAQSLGHDVLVSDNGTISTAAKLELSAKEIDFEEGQHSEERILEADLVVKSPGIPNSVPLIQALLNKGVEVISEIEFASRHTTKPIVAITGTNGKTTTTLLTHHLLRQEMGERVALGGNVGTSFARLVVDDANYDWYVLEISSFQLDDCTSFRPVIGAILNISPDHLDRYNNDFAQYAAAKFKLGAFQRTDDYLLLNNDDQGIATTRSNHQWASQTIMLDAPKAADSIWVDQENFPLGENLQGPHNWQNAKFAIRIARLVGASAESIRQGLATFQNAPHRMEPVASIDGVRYVNDSKATNVEATEYALRAFTEPIVWIVGGQDKGNDYQGIMDLVVQQVKAIICLGIDNYKLMSTFQPLEKLMVETRSMVAAVQTARDLAEAGDVVLLSPACASFDLFKNYMDRGDQFKAAVHQFTQKPTNSWL